MAYRVAEELVSHYGATVAVIVDSLESNWAPKIAKLPDVEMIESARLDEDTFRRAEIRRASALGLLEQNDARNIDAALVAQEVNPQLRLVVRMFNQSLGARINELLEDAVLRSVAAIAGPVFVAEALGETASPAMEVGDRTVVAAARAEVAPEDILLGLARTAADGAEPHLLPPDHRADDDPGDVVLAVSRAAPRAARRRRRNPREALAVLQGTRVRLVAGLALAILALGTAALWWAGGAKDGSLARSAYAAFLTEIGGADVDPAATGLEMVTLIVLSVISLALIPTLTAAVVDSAVKIRLRRESGGLIGTMSGHIVVVGLGHVGTVVVRTLHERGFDVVAIERNASASGVRVARDLGIPVLIGDASKPEMLRSAQVGRARALTIVSTDDVTNLEIALLGQQADENKDLRVVVRLFDGEFADRVQQKFHINASRSVSFLAAPTFASAMLGRQIIATIPVQREVLLVAEMPVGEESVLEGATPALVDADSRIRILAVRPWRARGALWEAIADHRLAPGDRVIVVATKDGMQDLLSNTRPGSARRSPRPEGAGAPQPRGAGTSAESSEGTAPHPPVGPADDAGSRPA
jgi:Trk K+ transport system NAD-binding subunit